MNRIKILSHKLLILFEKCFKITGESLIIVRHLTVFGKKNFQLTKT